MSNSKSVLSRDEVHLFVQAMTEEMQKPEFAEKLRNLAAREPVPRSEMELIVVFEQLQAEFLGAHFAAQNREKQDGVQSGSGSVVLDGPGILQELKKAVLCYPDEKTEMLIRRMCMLQESQMLSLCATSPALADLVKQQQGHSHGGHSHQHGPHCQHAHGHGHSHGTPDPKQMMGMQMAVQSLSPQLRQDMTRIQERMRSGQQPTPKEMAKIQEIQNHIMTFMATLNHFGGNGGNSSNTNTGNGGDLKDGGASVRK